MDIKDYDGRTPLHISASKGNIQITEFLLNKGFKLLV